jgi:hypothetical protein
MYKDGFTNIVNVDFCASIVKMMSDRYRDTNIPITCKK